LVSMSTKKDKDRREFQEFKERFSKCSNEKLIEILHMGFSNKLASQAINIILKERGVKRK
jgi:hypothetical protein